MRSDAAAALTDRQIVGREKMVAAVGSPLSE